MAGAEEVELNEAPPAISLLIDRSAYADLNAAAKLPIGLPIPGAPQVTADNNGTSIVPVKDRKGIFMAGNAEIIESDIRILRILEFSSPEVLDKNVQSQLIIRFIAESLAHHA